MLNQLLAMRVFARVVEAGSFTKAADSLNMPKTSVSKLINELETHLRVRLLQRTTRRVSVTDQGAAYYQQSTVLLREMDALDSTFQSAQALPSGKLRVEVGSSTATAVLIPQLPAFFARYPDIEVEMGVSDRPVDLVSDNIDCAIRGGPLGDVALAARALGGASWTTCAAPAYLERFGTPQHPSELEQGHRMVAYHSARTQRVLPARFKRGNEQLEVMGRGPFSTNESNAHLAAGVAGLGVIHSFTYTVQDAIKRGELVPILQDWRPAPYPFHALYPPNRHLSHRTRVFIDWLVECFATLA